MVGRQLEERFMSSNIKWFAELGMGDLEQVGGKNASLGEMVANLVSAGVKVPDGFATTADAFRRFMSQTGLDARINAELDALDVEDVRALAETGRGGPRGGGGRRA